MFLRRYEALGCSQRSGEKMSGLGKMSGLLCIRTDVIPTGVCGGSLNVSLEIVVVGRGREILHRVEWYTAYTAGLYREIFVGDGGSRRGPICIRRVR